MSFAKPLLVSYAVAQKNIVEKAESGLIHKAEDVTDFTVKVMDLYNSESIRAQFGEKGKSFIENEFYWEKTSEKLIEMYSSL